MMAARILIVDDDPQILRLLQAYLGQADFSVLTASDGETAWQLIRRERPDLVVLDLMLPGRDGWDITRRVRADEQIASMPIVLLTARVDDRDKIEGFELGADDYITKPFNAPEVVARVRAVLRRARGQPTQPHILEVRGLRLDLDEHSAHLDGQRLVLTPTEFAILRTLLEEPGRAFTRGELIDRALGYQFEGLERTLDSHIKNLRKKIEVSPGPARLYRNRARGRLPLEQRKRGGMNRLWLRLTLAFAAITLVSVGTVALLADWQAGNEFQQYVGQQQMLAQSGLADDLAAYYQRVGSWDGVQTLLASYVGPGMGAGHGVGNGRPAMLLADADGTIVYDARSGQAGGKLSAAEQGQALAISVANQTVGYLIVSSAGRGPAGLATAEQAFLNQLHNTFLIAAVAALGLGLLLSVWISRSLSAPLAQVQQAARAFAGHHWEQRVPVRGADEVADVAQAINQMAGALQGAESERRQLLADIAHELRTPLAVMQGNLRAMLDGVYPLEVAEIATVYDQSRLISRLVDDLGQLTLAETGHLRLSLTEIEIGPVVQAAIEDWTGVAQEQSITLRQALGPHLPKVRADANRLTQVLHNLIANALRHTPPGGSVTVSAEALAGGVRLVVADTGEGIAPEDLARVFDRFYRGDKARARGRGGSGLGLAITKAFIEAMGGTVVAESQVGVGSSFTVMLLSAVAAAS